MAQGIIRSRQPAVARLDPGVRVNSQDINSFGTVSQARGFSSDRSSMPRSFTVTLDNAAGATTAVYKIGDPQGIVEGAVGPAAPWLAPDSARGTTVAALQNSFVAGPILVKGFNLAATSGAVQFAEDFAFLMGEINGDNSKQTIDLNEFVRNNADNPNLLTMKFQEPYKLDFNSCFLITAGIAQVVKVTVFIEAVAGR